MKTFFCLFLLILNLILNPLYIQADDSPLDVEKEASSNSYSILISLMRKDYLGAYGSFSDLPIENPVQYHKLQKFLAIYEKFIALHPTDYELKRAYATDLLQLCWWDWDKGLQKPYHLKWAKRSEELLKEVFNNIQDKESLESVAIDIARLQEILDNSKEEIYWRKQIFMMNPHEICHLHELLNEYLLNNQWSDILALITKYQSEIDVTIEGNDSLGSQELFIRGFALEKTGSLDEAFIQYDQILSKYTSSESYYSYGVEAAYNGRGVLRYFLGDINGAWSDLIKGDILYNKALAYAYKKNNKTIAYELMEQAKGEATLANEKESIIRAKNLLSDYFSNKNRTQQPPIHREKYQLRSECLYRC